MVFVPTRLAAHCFFLLKCLSFNRIKEKNNQLPPTLKQKHTPKNKAPSYLT